MIVLYRGDSTGGALGRNATIVITTSIDLTGCEVVFNFQSYVKRFTGVKSGEQLKLHFSHNDTQKMSLGVGKAVIYLVDSAGNVRTLMNAIPVKVTSSLAECYNLSGNQTDEIHISMENTIPFDRVTGVPNFVRSLWGEAPDEAGDVSPHVVKTVNGIAADEKGNVQIDPITTYDVTKLGDYLYEVNADSLDAVSAEAYFKARFGQGAVGAQVFGGCTSIRIGNKYGRAYDWKYDESVSFLVRTKASGSRFASIAMCASPEGMTRQGVEDKTVADELWRVMPFMALDGINENGVVCNVNVIDSHGGEDIRWTGRDFCAVGAVRYVLDHAKTAREAAAMLKERAWMPLGETMGGYSLHFMVADAEDTFIVEEGVVYEQPKGGYSYQNGNVLTNFRISGLRLVNGKVDANAIASYDPYGTGLERYNEFAANATIGANDLRPALTELVYSIAYVDPYRRASDFAGITLGDGTRAKCNEPSKIYNWAMENHIADKWRNRTRDGQFWHTVHSCVYDFTEKSVEVVVQEGYNIHTFPLVKTDSQPADYDAVRENAAIGASHASETGNPHETTAEQVGVRVVELVVEGTAKNLYLMSNGERTTERVTSYAELLAMAKRGLVRLYYNAVGGTGRKALYTAHMVDDNGTPAMRFDATGTLGEKVYTRSIALTESGVDGIAVTIGALTEMQPALSSAQLANIADVQNKLAKSDVIDPATATILPGKAADAAAVKTAMAGKVDGVLDGYSPITVYTPIPSCVAYLEGPATVAGNWRVYYGGYGVGVSAVSVDGYTATLTLSGQPPWVSSTITIALNIGNTTRLAVFAANLTRGAIAALNIPTDAHISVLAEASIKVNLNAESTAVSSVTLKDGDVASVTMSGTTLAIDFDDARATGGLRLCELYISGATKDADLTFAEGETVVTDGNAFPKCEAGLNYYVFAEVAPNTWNVTRKTLQVVIPAPTTEG